MMYVYVCIRMRLEIKYRNDELNEEIELLRGHIEELIQKINGERDRKAQYVRKFEHMYVFM